MKWIEVAVRVSAARAEVAGDMLLRFAPQGFSEDADGRARRVLRAYLPATVAGRMSLARLRGALQPRNADCALRTRIVRDAGWARAWRAHARTIRIGRLIIQPTWKDRPAFRDSAGTAVVRLDPGMAFGSGEHASTRLCLRAIERYVRPGATVLDVGTGSGILAIAAARLGAGQVQAIDNDPVAIVVARANVRANGVAPRVRLRRGDGLARVEIRADLIVANLTADILPAIVPDVAKRLTRHGRFVASGFGPPRAPDVRRFIARSGLRVVATERLAGWCAVHATR